MKRWLWLAAAVMIVAFLSGERGTGADVGQLQPIQTVRVARETWITIDTDTGERGTGETLADAFRDLNATAPGKVFLETAEFLILAPGCESLLPELAEYLRPSCCVCMESGETDIQNVGEYLEAHPPAVTLAKWRAGETAFPTLIIREGRMELVS